MQTDFSGEIAQAVIHEMRDSGVLVE